MKSFGLSVLRWQIARNIKMKVTLIRWNISKTQTFQNMNCLKKRSTEHFKLWFVILTLVLSEILDIKLIRTKMNGIIQK